MYWVEWNTLKARPARKSLEDSSPATGLSWKPVVPEQSPCEREMYRPAHLIHTLEEVRNSLQLRDFILIIAAVLLQKRKDVVVLVAGVALVESLQVVEHSPPGSLLLRGVLNAWNLLSTIEEDLLKDKSLLSNEVLLLVEEGDVSKFLPPFPVDRISEAGVVRVKLRSVGQNLIGKLVQVLNLPREPRNSFGVVFDVSGNDLEVA